MASNRFLTWIAAFGTCLAACDGGKPADLPRGPALGGLPVWTIDSVADVVIGHRDAAQSPLLGRVIGARRLPDGSIVVSDGQAAEITRFDNAGQYVATVGRTGSGPAEFRSPGPPTGFAGDSFFVVDLDQRRVTVFDERGRPAGSRVFLLQTGSGVFAPLGLVSADRFVGIMITWAWPERPGHRVRTSMAVVAGEFGRPDVDTISAGHGDELVGGIWREGGEALVVGYPLEFGSATKVAVGGRRIYVGETALPRVQVYDFSGRRIHEIAWSAPADPVTAADRQARIAAESIAVARGPSSHAEQTNSQLEHLRSQEFAKEAPAFTGLLPADDGTVWVERDPRPWAPTRGYVVFDSTGAPIAEVALPRAFQPYQVDSAQALGRWRHPDSADQVRLYRLSR